MKDYDGQRQRSKEFLRRWRRRKAKASKKAAGPPAASGAPPEAAGAGPPPPADTCLLCGRPLREGEGRPLTKISGDGPDQLWPETERYLGVICADCDGLPPPAFLTRLAAAAEGGRLDSRLPLEERERFTRGLRLTLAGDGRRRPPHG
jgi:hypothetical protein